MGGAWNRGVGKSFEKNRALKNGIQVHAIAAALGVLAVLCGIVALCSHHWMIHKDEGKVSYLGLLRVKECTSEGCKKIGISKSEYSSFSHAGKIAFPLLLIGILITLLAAGYYALNAFGSRMTSPGAHMCLSAHGIIGAGIMLLAWVLWVAVAPHGGGWKLGFSFVLAIVASLIAAASYGVSMLKAKQTPAALLGSQT
ncbi:hypothetical protein Pelo_13120 [Pelomyxa schiedti]|nr:hypothetical protein Pelo_13120 [Pelomyxa schiedti]